MIQTIADRIRYERTFTLAERIDRAKDKGAMWLARRLPERLTNWVVICRHADVTRGDQHPDTVAAFDLYRPAR